MLKTLNLILLICFISLISAKKVKKSRTRAIPNGPVLIHHKTQGCLRRLFPDDNSVQYVMFGFLECPKAADDLFLFNLEPVEGGEKVIFNYAELPGLTLQANYMNVVARPRLADGDPSQLFFWDDNLLNQPSQLKVKSPENCVFETSYTTEEHVSMNNGCKDNESYKFMIVQAKDIPCVFGDQSECPDDSDEPVVSDPDPVPAPIGYPPADVTFQLTWTGEADLDLYAKCDGEYIYHQQASSNDTLINYSGDSTTGEEKIVVDHSRAAFCSIWVAHHNGLPLNLAHAAVSVSRNDAEQESFQVPEDHHGRTWYVTDYETSTGLFSRDESNVRN